MLKSTSLINRARYTKEKKVKNRAIGAMIGMFFLYAMMMGYFFASCIGLGVMGLQETIPEMCAISVSAVAFLFSVFKVNGYLFNFKEYDMLMALPYSPSDIAAAKFLYMYYFNGCRTHYSHIVRYFIGKSDCGNKYTLQKNKYSADCFTSACSCSFHRIKIYYGSNIKKQRY